MFNSTLNIVQVFKRLLFVNVVQYCSGPTSRPKMGVWGQKFRSRPISPLAARKLKVSSEMMPFHGASHGPILVKIRPFWSKASQTRVVLGLRRPQVTLLFTKSLTLSYCCSELPLLFCCYCSTVTTMSFPNVTQL